MKYVLLMKYVFLNPFETDKMAANGNLRLCLKSKPQVKCLQSLSAG